MVRFLEKIRHSLKSKDNLINQNNHLKGMLFRNDLLKRRSPAALGLMSGTVVKNGLFEPLVDTRLLIWAAENNWMLGTAIDKVQIETTKEGWEWKPKFVAKCNSCQTTYDEVEPDVCENCGGNDFAKPNKKQLKYINQLFEKPNTDQDGRVTKSFIDILSDLCHYNQTIDDYYLETSLNRWGNPAEIFPLSSEQIRIAVDDTTKEKFCPNCYEPDQTYSDKKTICPKCGGELKDTMYVQLEGNTKNIEARWDSKSVLHSNSRAWGNRVYGIPKIWSVWAVAQTLKWMEYYNWSAYSQNKMPDSFIFFPGMSTMQVNKMIEEVVTFKEANPQVKKSVWMGSDAGGVPINVQTMFSLKDMMSVEMAHFYREAIAIRYGVSLQMVGIETPGKLGNSETSAGVSYDTIVETQRQLSEFINSKLVPLFVYPEPITDWEFSLISPQKEDKQADATLKATNIAGVVSLRASGIDAILNEHTFDIEIRDQPAPKDNMPFDPMTFSKARIYLAPGENPPEGYIPSKGPKGGRYYESESPAGQGEEPQTSVQRLTSLSPHIGNPKYNLAVGDLGERIAQYIPQLSTHHLTEYSEIPPELSKKYNIAKDGRNAPFDMLNGTAVEIKVTRRGKAGMWSNQYKKKLSFSKEINKPWVTVILMDVKESGIDVYHHKINFEKMGAEKIYEITTKNSTKIGRFTKDGKYEGENI